MKKHSAWQKDRNRVRRLNREAKAIIRRDDARAEWFNSRFAAAQEKALASSIVPYVWFLDRDLPPASEWPDIADMFIEVTPHQHGRQSVPPGLYVVRMPNLGIDGRFDRMLNVQNVNTGAEEFFWFPRMGQRVVSCGEVGETPWLD